MGERTPLREQIKQYLLEERLDNRQYESLRQKLEQSDADVPLVKFHNRRFFWVSAAAILVFTTALSVIQIFSSAEKGSTIQQRIAEEVATNHIKIQRPDLETSSMEEIRIYFDRLDFIPAGSDLIDLNNYLLKGARYCTLQGKIAAHLLLDSPQGNPISHYQAAYDRERFGIIPDIAKNEEPRIITSRGVVVHIWVERDLLMAQAHTIQNNQDATLIDYTLFPDNLKNRDLYTATKINTSILKLLN